MAQLPSDEGYCVGKHNYDDSPHRKRSIRDFHGDLHSHSSKRRRSSSLSPQRNKSASSPESAHENQASGKALSCETRKGIFVWKKKVDLERKLGKVVTAESEASRIKALDEELAEAQRQRAKRDAERAEWEAEMRKEARRKEQERYAEDIKAEATFEGRQHFARQEIRLREGRPGLVDSLARVVRLDVPGIDTTTAENGNDILALIHSMATDDASAALDNIGDELDYAMDFPAEDDNSSFNHNTRMAFWESARAVIMDVSQGQYDGGVHPAVITDVNALLRDKRVDKLLEMEQELVKQLKPSDNNNSDFGETDFWAYALKRIRLLLAEHRLRDIVIQMRAERSRRETAQRVNGVNGDVDPTNRLRGARVRSKDADMVLAEASKGMSENETMFADEVETSHDKISSNSSRPIYARNDKFRPRKPLYFNRVHIGYNWTKYNRTHYDQDNPPPKTVQGYKFNIFYPDLIDSSCTPTYAISKTDNPEVGIITFKAGPPYEDLAFKIVNRPWERSHKRGYRCSFDRGVLQLWFYFQRYRYRR